MLGLKFKCQIMFTTKIRNIKKGHLNNFFKMFEDIFHQDAGRLEVNLEAVPVLPKIFEVFSKLENFRFLFRKNLTNGDPFLRLPGLTENARNEDRLDLV